MAAKAFVGALGLTLALAIPPERVVAVCGDGVTDGMEECDDGGLCLGGMNAGAECQDDAECAGGECVPFGGDGCAANCTEETDVSFAIGGTSQVDLLLQVGGSLPFSPIFGAMHLTIGREVDGEVPVVVKATPWVRQDTSFGCFCIRGLPARTCGGRRIQEDGVTPAVDCTVDAGVCPGEAPCAFLHGPGNAGAGTIGCNGFAGVNASSVLDCRVPGATPVYALSGEGGAGSAVIWNTFAVRQLGPSCNNGPVSTHGPDRMFCTDDDPQDAVGRAITVPFVTGEATTQVMAAIGGVMPSSFAGTPFICSGLSTPPPSTVGAIVVAGFGECTASGDFGYLFRFEGVAPPPTPTSTATAAATGTATPTASAAVTSTSPPTVTATVASSVTPTGSPAITPTAPQETETPHATATPTPPVSPTPAGVFAAGDANCDEAVTAADLPALIEEISRGGSPTCGSDANRDHAIDATDIEATLGVIFERHSRS